jgi:hypothetical protein
MVQATVLTTGSCCFAPETEEMSDPTELLGDDVGPLATFWCDGYTKLLFFVADAAANYAKTFVHGKINLYDSGVAFTKLLVIVS